MSTADRAMIERLVAEVIGRLRAEAAPAAGAALADRVITLATLERLPAGTRSVVIDAKAVVTPSARDHAKAAGLTIARGGSPAAAGAAAGPRPFVIAHAECTSDPAAKAAAVARAVPGAQRLPSSGLADVIAALATHASRDAARGILLTGRPAVAAILANRSAYLRAVTGRDATHLAAAAAACAANLLVVDPAAFAGGLERLCADFATRPSGPLPPELAAAPAGCGCQAHPH
jgi:hypothetical protein